MSFFSPSSGTVHIQNVDQMMGNTNLTGVWFFRLERNAILSSAGKKCNEWFRQQNRVTIPALPPCPCLFGQATLDKRYFVDYNQTVSKRGNGTICAYSVPSRWSRWVQQCCYTDLPSGGKVLSLSPPESGGAYLIAPPVSPLISDADGHEFCCSSSQCSLYYSRRPSRSCIGYTLRRRGKSFHADVN